MKRLFVKTNAYNAVLFVDENNKAFKIDDSNENDLSTIERAKTADYSNLDGCETADECMYAVGVDEKWIIDFNENDFEEIIEF